MQKRYFIGDKNKMDISNLDFEHISCNLCNSKSYDFLFTAKDWFFEMPGEFPVVKCKNCGLVYLNPRLTSKAISNYYPKDYYTHVPLVSNKDFANSTNKFNLIIKIKEKIKSLLINYYYGKSPRWKRFLSVFIILLFNKRIYTKNRRGLIGESGRLLDLGCGNGSYLYNIKQDWLVGKKIIDCFGVDIDRKALKYALEGGLKVKEGTLTSVAFPDDYFDIVRIGHTLEHISDPLGVLKEVFRITKQRGKVIIEIPNFDSIGCKLLKDKWAGIDAPRHYFHFSPETLKKMLEICGFQCITIAKHKGISDIKLSLEWVNKFWNSVGLKGPIRKIKQVGLSFLLHFIDYFYRGGCFSIKAIKKQSIN